mgnify:CR=1 FL=1
MIQYIYAKYGRDRAGLAATVITYRARSALREVGKVMGLSADAVSAMSGSVWGWSSSGPSEREARAGGLDTKSAGTAHVLRLASDIIGFPRHLSQHVGGFVITAGPLSEMVPIENAAMADRTVIEWDKDDLDAVGMLKIDVLALGMLTCIAKAFDLIAAHHGRRDVPRVAGGRTQARAAKDMAPAAARVSYPVPTGGAGLAPGPPARDTWRGRGRR